MRTISTLAVAAVMTVSGSAMAAQITGTYSTPGLKLGSVGSPTTYTTHAGPETVLSYDVSGIVSSHEFGEPGNTIVSLDFAAMLGAPSGTPVTVSGLGYDVNVTANDPSWLSELVVSFGPGTGNDAEIFLTPVFDQDNPGTASASSGGMIDLSSIPLPNIELPNGTMYMEFFEGFDDSSVDPDGIWNSGSLSFEATAQNVPEPTTLGLVALGSLISLRRARRA